MSSRNRGAGTTRDRILSAARRLLEEKGYSIGLEQVAREAGVSRQALYLHFGSKSSLLIALVEWVDEQGNLAKLFAPVWEANSGAEALTRAIAATGQYAPTIHRLAMVLEVARRSDPDAAAAWDDRMSSRAGAIRAIVEWIEKDGHLAIPWTVDEAVDLIWTAILPQTYQALVLERGWSNDRWVSATTESLMRTLVKGTNGN
jgi:AcrR family transcriptional regulator